MSTYSKETERLLSLDETKTMLGVSLQTVRRMIDDGSLPSVRIRTRVMVPHSAVQKLTEVRS